MKKHNFKAVHLQKLKFLEMSYNPSWIIIVFVAMVFLSCATAPRLPAPDPILENRTPELSVLPAGGRVYVWADTVMGRPLLDLFAADFAGGRAAERMLDSTSAAAAVLFETGEDRQFFLAATGRYPRHRGNISFAFSRGWRRQRGYDRQTFWLSRDNNMAVALGANLALVSNIDPFEGFAREIPPQTFAEFSQAMAVAGWLRNPSEAINGFIENLGLPLQIPAEDFFFGVLRSPEEDDAGPWELVFRIRSPSELHARSLIVLFATASFFVLQMAPGVIDGPYFSTQAGSISLQEVARLLFANVPVQDGEFLTLRISSLDENTIALLFGLFSVYSN